VDSLEVHHTYNVGSYLGTVPYSWPVLLTGGIRGVLK